MAKRYLNVSYKDRELAKRLGARWDPSVKRWYCPAGSQLATIFAWRKDVQVKQTETKIVSARQFAGPKPGHIAHNENFELPLAG